MVLVVHLRWKLSDAKLESFSVFPKSGRSFMLYSLSRDLSLALCPKGGKG